MNIAPNICAAAFFLTLLVISARDAKTQIISNASVITAAFFAALYLAALFINDAESLDLTGRLLGMFFGGGVIFLIDRAAVILLRRDGFGYGDVKLMAVCGLFLGFKLSLFSLLAAFAGCALVSAALLLLGRLKRTDYIAFGPFICAASLFAYFRGGALIAWYIGFVTGLESRHAQGPPGAGS
jgi:leader peptidase (prepilin peptidase)/N-methyltransferase